MGFVRIKRNNEKRGMKEKRENYSKNKLKLEIKSYNRKKEYKKNLKVYDTLGSITKADDCWHCNKIVYDEILCSGCRVELDKDYEERLGLVDVEF